ncbi:hypothetical protein [Actinacidiphila glaucinigra]|uniref:hypothetical protein n=1 Tax=Actinacidiphila glaucinigra TaxID=235986 RepID=UPI0036E5C792
MAESHLQAMSDKASPEARALAEGLREVFGGLGISVRRYAARCHRDPGTVSRYLNGSRVPPWPFVRQLISDVSEARKQPMRVEVFDHVRALHRTALQASNADLYALQVLQDQLEDADREQRRAALREEALLEALQTRQQRIAELETSQLELEGAVSQERARRAELAISHTEESGAAAEEIARLQAEIEELRGQLAWAHDAKTDAEEKCVDLERKLQLAEASAQSGQEARENEDLNQALREMAEAKAEIARLMKEMEDLKGGVTFRPEPSARFLKRQEEKRKRIEEVIAQTPEELAATALRMVTLDGGQRYELTTAIGSSYPLERVVEALDSVQAANIETAIQIIIAIAETRSPSDIFWLVVNKGSAHLGRHGRLRDDLLTWFGWERSGGDIRELIYLFREAGRNTDADELMREAAEHQEAPKLLNTFMSLDRGDRQYMLQHVAALHPIEGFPALLMRMEELGEEAKVSTLQLLCEIRPEEARKLSKNLRIIDMATDASIIDDRLREAR